MNKIIGNIINKSGLVGKNAREMKTNLQEYLQREVDWNGGFKNEGEAVIHYGITNNGNTWQQATFYWNISKTGNLIIK